MLTRFTGAYMAHISQLDQQRFYFCEERFIAWPSDDLMCTNETNAAGLNQVWPWHKIYLLANDFLNDISKAAYNRSAPFVMPILLKLFFYCDKKSDKLRIFRQLLFMECHISMALVALVLSSCSIIQICYYPYTMDKFIFRKSLKQRWIHVQWL